MNEIVPHSIYIRATKGPHPRDRLHSLSFLWHGRKRNATLRQCAMLPYGPRLPQNTDDLGAMLQLRSTQITSTNQSERYDQVQKALLGAPCRRTSSRPNLSERSSSTKLTSQYAFHNLSSSFTNKITRPVMSHRYSLRPHAKGRRGHQTADESGGQVKGTTSQSTSTDGILASEGGHDILTDELEDKPSTFELRPTAPYSSRAAHNTSTPTLDSEEDWRRTTRYRVQGPAETSEEIQAARKRVEVHYRSLSHKARADRTRVRRGPARADRGPSS